MKGSVGEQRKDQRGIEDEGEKQKEGYEGWKNKKRIKNGNDDESTGTESS